MSNVTSRRFRPSAFSEIVGQDHITRTLVNSITGGRLHHAYLFMGVRGTGKTTMARVFAKALNCLDGPTPTPCGGCASCMEIAVFSSPDVREMDAASNTGIDDIREAIVDQVAMKPLRDRFKVFIIDEVHQLSTKAFDALLKTLEEPPEHAMFILATTEAHKIPETISSRCQTFEFRRIPAQVIAKRLRAIVDEMNNPWLPQDVLVAKLVGEVEESQSAFQGMDDAEISRRYRLLDDFLATLQA